LLRGVTCGIFSVTFCYILRGEGRGGGLATKSTTSAEEDCPEGAGLAEQVDRLATKALPCDQTECLRPSFRRKLVTAGCCFSPPP
jgi:hypothetical protein